MLLAIDIGNTNIKLALFEGKRIICNRRLLTDKAGNRRHYEKRIKGIFAGRRLKNIQIDEIIICSVVSKLTSVFKKALFSLFKKKALILGKDIFVPVKNFYKKPKQVGQDRLANALAAFNKYGGPTIVVDFGTALTFDLVTAAGSYLGGVIVPGVEISLKALSECADLLPEITLKRPKALLGRETAASMQSGIVYGYSFLVEGILGQIKREMNLRPRVVATGGCAALMAGYCRSINRVDKNLTLEGLRLVYKKIEKNRKKA